jgi:type VI secretion system protein ImpL
MMSLRRIFGLMLLFFFFEAVVAVVTTFAWPDVNVFLACLAMTGLAVGVWAVFTLVTRVMMRPRAPQAPPPQRPAVAVAPRASFGDDGFTQELNSLVAEANRRLAGALPLNARGEPPTVATLPLYFVIGGEGAGKTSAILNSGLEPRLLSGEASREGTVIPTRLCNLWFAEGAIFADISGRVLTQDAENWDRALRVLSQTHRIPRWKQVLFGRRSQSNLKGLVLVCDASLFVKASDPQRISAIARTLSDRLQTMGTVFRREFPVYVVFSKCDGVQYFPEFFSHLSEPEGRRLLGVTLPFVRQRNDTADIYADREGKRLTNYFNRLYMSLAEKRLVLLAREDEAAKKSTAYEFPRELKKIRSDVVQFLLDVFRPNPLQLGPRLRGF